MTKALEPTSCTLRPIAKCDLSRLSQLPDELLSRCKTPSRAMISDGCLALLDTLGGDIIPDAEPTSGAFDEEHDQERRLADMRLGSARTTITGHHGVAYMNVFQGQPGSSSSHTAPSLGTWKPLIQNPILFRGMHTSMDHHAPAKMGPHGQTKMATERSKAVSTNPRA